MKIIRQGNLDWSAQITCRSCQSVLEIGIDDLKYESGDQRDPGYHYIVCAICNTRLATQAPANLDAIKAARRKKVERDRYGCGGRG